MNEDMTPKQLAHAAYVEEKQPTPTQELLTIKFAEWIHEHLNLMLSDPEEYDRQYQKFSDKQVAILRGEYTVE